MLTVKHIDARGCETVIGTASVRTITDYGPGPFGDRIELLDDDQMPIRIFSGAIFSGSVYPTEHCQIFVMNERGSTVAVYRYSEESPSEQSACAKPGYDGLAAAAQACPARAA